MDVPVQQDGVTTLAASDYNQTNTELEAMIETSGQTKSAGDLVQVEKAVQQIAVSGQFYVDSGAANTVTLANPNNPILESYRDGAAVRFIAANTNSGVSTVVIDALPTVTLKTIDGNDVTAGYIVAGLSYVITYKLSSNIFNIQYYYTDEDITSIKETCFASYNGADAAGNSPVITNRKGITSIVSSGVGASLTWDITFIHTYVTAPNIMITVIDTNAHNTTGVNVIANVGGATLVILNGPLATDTVLNGFSIDVKGVIL